MSAITATDSHEKEGNSPRLCTCFTNLNLKAQFGDAAPVGPGYITFNHSEEGSLMYY